MSIGWNYRWEEVVVGIYEVFRSLVVLGGVLVEGIEFVLVSLSRREFFRGFSDL